MARTRPRGFGVGPRNLWGIMGQEMNQDTVVYFNNRFLPLAEARVGVLTHALHYGTGVFDGIRGYWNAELQELFLLRPLEHYRRWKANCGILHIGVEPAAEVLWE